MSVPSKWPLKIVGLGDSTTAGTPGFRSPLESPPGEYGDEESQYAYWMMRSHPDWKVLNRGINGERSDQILARFQRDAAAEEPRFVVLLAGVNDIYQGYPVGSAIGNLLKMYEMTLDIQATPVACSVLPYNTMRPGEALKRRELNKLVVGNSARLGIPFCDTAQAVADPEDSDKLAGTPDGLHPDVEGYRRMAAVISKAIVEELRKDPDSRFRKR